MWQMNLLWPMDPPPSESSIDALNTATPNLADELTLANGPTPSESSINALNTATPNLADETTLANGPPWLINHRCLECHYTKCGR